MFLYLPSFIILIGEGFVRLFNWPNNEKYFDEFKEKVKIWHDRRIQKYEFNVGAMSCRTILV